MKRIWLLFSQAVTVLVAAYFVVATLQPGWLDRGTTRSGAGIAPILGLFNYANFDTLKFGLEAMSSRMGSPWTHPNAIGGIMALLRQRFPRATPAQLVARLVGAILSEFQPGAPAVAAMQAHPMRPHRPARDEAQAAKAAAHVWRKKIDHGGRIRRAGRRGSGRRPHRRRCGLRLRRRRTSGGDGA